jgi:VWFA-related protein
MFSPMRAAILCLLCAWACRAQFRSTVPLVVAPTTVKDSKGRFVDGLEASDLVLYDNNVPRPIQMEIQMFPISLVVCVETCSNSRPILDKLGSSGILFSQLVAADQGETALLGFSGKVNKLVDFTSDPDNLTFALKKLHKGNSKAVALDALMQAMQMLSHRPTGRRPIILMIAEERDRSSSYQLAEVAHEAQRLNVAVYWLSYSPFWAPFTDRKIKTYGDVESPTDKGKDKKHDATPVPDDAPVPNLLEGVIAGIGEMVHATRPNLASLFPRLTGAREIAFFTKGGLEQAVHAVGEEVHRQYILTFQPPPSTPGLFHTLRVEVKERPDLQAKTREGYWAVQ